MYGAPYGSIHYLSAYMYSDMYVYTLSLHIYIYTLGARRGRRAPPEVRVQVSPAQSGRIIHTYIHTSHRYHTLHNSTYIPTDVTYIQYDNITSCHGRTANTRQTYTEADCTCIRTCHTALAPALTVHHADMAHVRMHVHVAIRRRPCICRGAS